ncbi:MAG: MgtC/SapB family protein [Clostridia bacterium]|nr:MgtC/SapB family protein [Clostridia bacterium]
MNLSSFEADIDIVIVQLIRLLVAALCGVLIGFERKTRMKEAGLRTHAIVSLGSALFTIISIYGFSANHDSSRVAAQIVTGIGFLGAGMIIFRRNTLHGLTTAAGIWATAGIGMAMGAGLYEVGLFATVIILLFQYLLHSKFKIFQMKKTTTLIIECDANAESIEIIEKLFNVKDVYRTKITKNGGEISMTVTIKTYSEFSVETLLKYVKENSFIKKIDNTEDV